MIGAWLQAGAVLTLALFGTLFQTRLAGQATSVSPLVLGLLAALAAFFAVRRGRLERLLQGKGPSVIGACTLLVLVVLVVFGRRYRGGLYLPGRINPSEIVKLGTVFFSAGFLAQAKGRPTLPFLFGVGGVALLAAAAGDFGLVAQLALTVCVLLFVASWGWGLAAFGVLATGAVAAARFPFGHLAVRFAVWRDPVADATGAGWQTLQGLVAILRGGFAGVGYGIGEADQVPIVSSDFVYAALAEDFGILGCTVVLGIWAVVLLRAFATARRAVEEDCEASALVATGLAASLLVQIALNVAGVLNALPMTGIPLPLISHGGTSLLVTLAMCGVLVGLNGSFEPASPASSSSSRKRGGRGSGDGRKGTPRTLRPARRYSTSPSRS